MLGLVWQALDAEPVQGGEDEGEGGEEQVQGEEAQGGEEQVQVRSFIIFFFSSFSDPDPAIYLSAAPDLAPGFAILLDVKTLHVFFSS